MQVQMCMVSTLKQRKCYSYYNYQSTCCKHKLLSNVCGHTVTVEMTRTMINYSLLHLMIVLLQKYTYKINNKPLGIFTFQTSLHIFVKFSISQIMFKIHSFGQRMGSIFYYSCTFIFVLEKFEKAFFLFKKYQKTTLLHNTCSINHEQFKYFNLNYVIHLLMVR